METRSMDACCLIQSHFTPTQKRLNAPTQTHFNQTMIFLFWPMTRLLYFIIRPVTSHQATKIENTHTWAMTRSQKCDHLFI